MFSVVVMLSGNGSNFQAILDKCKNIKIVGVISDQINAYGIKRAQGAKIPVVYHGQGDNQTREEYCEQLITETQRFKPDLIVLAGFMKILTPNFIDAFNGKIINIHPSLLPKYKGTDTHRRVLESDDKEHGITIHYATEELDSGPIILQQSLMINTDDTEVSLENKIHNLEHIWCPYVVDKLASTPN